MQSELGSFLARERDRPLPRFVECAFRGFLDCGILAHGYLRVTIELAVDGIAPIGRTMQLVSPMRSCFIISWSMPKPLHIETPLLQSRSLSIAAGRAVWMKLEAVQPPGSFKIRGIGLACQEYVRRGARRLISSSGGNAGIAVAYAGRHLSVPVVVVVPQTTTEQAKALIRQEDAEVVVHGSNWHEANVLALSMVGESDAFLHPFDDPLVWQGHASLVDEVVQSGVAPDAVVLSVGGGGLLSGIVEGLHRNCWADVPVIAVETAGADALAQSLRAGHRVRLSAITSIATSLAAPQICEQAFNWASKHPVRSVVVSDQAAVAASLKFLADHRIVVEPACGASLAVCYGGAVELAAFKCVLVVVCGGAGTSVARLQELSNECP